MGTIRDGENILGEVFEHSNFGTCSTLASEQIKEVYCPLFRYYIGARISIKFTHGNTAGTCVGTDSNAIDPLVAPKISLNGQTHTIYVGGEPAGEGFINAGDVHDFVFDGENWADITADVIYKGGNDTSGYYEKARNGKIEQNKIVNGGAGVTFNFPIIMSDTKYQFLFCGVTPTDYGVTNIATTRYNDKITFSSVQFSNSSWVFVYSQCQIGVSGY